MDNEEPDSLGVPIPRPVFILGETLNQRKPGLLGTLDFTVLCICLIYTRDEENHTVTALIFYIV